jgi:hypothetical protein
VVVGLIADVPLAQVASLSDVHDARYVWRAMEPVELLQSAGRWANAVETAHHVEERQLPGKEGDPGRLFSRCFTMGAEMLRLLVEDRADVGAVRAATANFREAVADPRTLA